MKYKVIIFDLDGTILDTLEDLTIAVNYALEQNGLNTRTIDEVRRFVGNGIGMLIKLSVPEDSSPILIDKVKNIFIPYYQNHCDIHTQPYKGILPLLKRLKENGFLTAIVSNKPDAAVHKLCDQYFPGLFDYVVGEKVGVRRKPAPDGIDAVLRKFSLTKSQATYIGDSEVDIETGKKSGINVISVTYGFRSSEFLLNHGAEKLVHNPDNLFFAIQEDVVLQEDEDINQ